MSKRISRRGFLRSSAAVSTAMAMSAVSYGRVVGANDRLRIGIIGLIFDSAKREIREG